MRSGKWVAGSLSALAGVILLSLYIGVRSRHSQTDGQRPREPGSAPNVATKSQKRNPGDTIVNSVGMSFAYVPSGEFLMGSPESEPDHSSIYEYQHRVRISQSYYLGVHEVTQRQYKLIMDENPSNFANGGFYKETVLGLNTDHFPIETVSWMDAEQFCRKLSELPEERRAGRQYRLPTEAEWEYACRAGTTTAFNCGTTLSLAQANISNLQGQGLRRPTDVGSYPPNAWGLHDMHGNVFEWVADGFGFPKTWSLDEFDEEDNPRNRLYWTPAYYYRHSPVHDPQGPENLPDSFRMVRGGSWESDPDLCRSARRRSANSPDLRDFVVGFRVVCEKSLSHD